MVTAAAADAVAMKRRRVVESWVILGPSGGAAAARDAGKPIPSSSALA
jgi:hypothetical protein